MNAEDLLILVVCCDCYCWNVAIDCCWYDLWWGHCWQTAFRYVATPKGIWKL